MTLQQITADDIAGWDSLDNIASSFEKRGLKTRPNLGEENELVLQLTDTEFIKIVEAEPGESATDFKPDNRNRRTNLVATNDFEEFTFLTRIRSWEGQQHGRIKHQKLSFTKDQMTSESGEKNTILQKLNSIEYGSAEAIQGTLYDTKQVVKEFYNQFENLRTDLVQEVANIPDNRGDAKQRYVQVVLDRMIFLYFIQEKRLLDRDIDYLHKNHEEVVDEGKDVYEVFYHPLFFDMLAEGNQDPYFGSLPHLNGGLFSKNPVEEEFEDVRLGEGPDQTNELFGDILDFLSDWNWNVDERLDIVDPKNLSPAILGHIFEQTVNQKEMGAYYTPEEMTGFMARRTIHPYLLDQLNEVVDTEYEKIDELFGLSVSEITSDAEAFADGGKITTQAPVENVQTDHIETLYHDILTEIRVLDPAVGSGAFLLAAQEVLLDIYVQCIEFFQQLDQSGMGWDLENRTREELEKVESSQGGIILHAKRKIILSNLYGVDIDEGAVEICKLRLWLSMVADIEDEPNEVEPLPNIDFNIRQGNSLIGFTDVEETATEDGDASLANYGVDVGDSVREMYDDVIKAVESHREAESGQEAANARDLAESRIANHSHSLNKKILNQFHDAGIENLSADRLSDFSPFHWVLEFATVYQDGGFDVIVGNPPWDVLTASRDDFFSKYDETFRTRTPDQKDDIMDEILEEDEIEAKWETYQHEMEMRTSYFTDTGRYTMQTPTVAGQTNTNENDLSALFLERVFSLLRPEGYAAQVLPGNVFNGSATKDLRDHLLNETTVETIVEFENHGIFEQIDNRYRFGIVTFKNSGTTESLKGIFQQRDLEILENIESQIAEMPQRVLADYSPEASIFPAVSSQAEADVLKKILQWPSVSEEISDKWCAIAHRELILAYDDDRLIESETPAGDYPVLGGANFYQFSHDSTFHLDLEEPTFWSVNEDEDPEKSAKKRVREKAFNGGDLKKKIYQTFGGEKSSKSQIGFVNDLLEEYRGEQLKESDIRLDCTEYRIVFRDVANSTNERTMIATVLPPGPVCVDSVRTIRPFEIAVEEEHLSNRTLKEAYQRRFIDEELFVLVGLLNSVPFDFLMRSKVSTHIPKYKFEEAQIPRLTTGDNWFKYISERAARLNCYGSEFAEMRERLNGINPATDEEERLELQAEIDAAAFHAYGLERSDVQFVLDDFHRVEKPRMMDEDYFDLVFEKYDLLEQEGPYE